MSRRMQVLSRRAFLVSGVSAAVAAGAPLRTMAMTGAGVPRRSDICFSSRFGAVGTVDPFEVASAFYATRIDWTYGSAEFLKQASRRGYTCSAALNPLIARSGEIDDRVRDRAGNPVTAPWMRWPGAYWGCVNNPRFRSIFLERARIALAAGAKGIQVDDPAMNMAAVSWGGCWCAFCKEKADARGIDLGPQMLGFQTQSVADFFSDFRTQIGRDVAVSSNNYGLTWSFPYSLFTFGMAEIDGPQLTPKYMFEKLSAAEALGKRQVVTFRSENVDDNRRAIGAAYAMGALPIAPWDVYLKSTPEGSKRFFGRPEDYADLYSLVRARQLWLDDFDLFAALGPGVELRPEILKSDAPEDLHVLRQAPDGRLALHLVNWTRSRPVTISVMTTRRSPVLAGQNTDVPLKFNSSEGRIEFIVPPVNSWSMVLI